MSKTKISEALKRWNRQARSRAKAGECAVINCKVKVPEGKAFCKEHQ